MCICFGLFFVFGDCVYVILRYAPHSFQLTVCTYEITGKDVGIVSGDVYLAVSASAKFQTSEEDKTSHRVTLEGAVGAGVNLELLKVIKGTFGIKVENQICITTKFLVSTPPPIPSLANPLFVCPSGSIESCRRCEDGDG